MPIAVIQNLDQGARTKAEESKFITYPHDQYDMNKITQYLSLRCNDARKRQYQKKNFRHLFITISLVITEVHVLASYLTLDDFWHFLQFISQTGRILPRSPTQKHKQQCDVVSS